MEDSSEDDGLGTSFLDFVACSLIGVLGMLVVAMSLITPALPQVAATSVSRDSQYSSTEQQAIRGMIVIGLDCPVPGLHASTASASGDGLEYKAGVEIGEASALAERVLISRGIESRVVREALLGLLCATQTFPNAKEKRYRGGTVILPVNHLSSDMIRVRWQLDRPAQKITRDDVCADLMGVKRQSTSDQPCRTLWNSIVSYDTDDRARLIVVHEKILSDAELRVRIQLAATSSTAACIRLITPRGALAKRTNVGAAGSTDELDPAALGSSPECKP